MMPSVMKFCALCILSLAAFATAQQNTPQSGSQQQSQQQSRSGATPPPSSPAAPSPSILISTSLSTGVVFGPNRQPTPVTSAFNITITVTPTPSAVGNTTAGNVTSAGNATSAPPSSTAPLPTAPTGGIDGGGNGPQGAPSPGAQGAGGVFGPPDGYVSSGVPLRERSALAVAVAGMVVGGGLALI